MTVLWANPASNSFFSPLTSFFFFFFLNTFSSSLFSPCNASN